MGKPERIIVIFLLAVLLSCSYGPLICRAGEEQPPRQAEEPPPLNLGDMLPRSQDPPPEPMRMYTITDRRPSQPAQGRIESSKPSEQAQAQAEETQPQEPTQAQAEEITPAKPGQTGPELWGCIPDCGNWLCPCRGRRMQPQPCPCYHRIMRNRNR
ncbi:MAG: hypothetical protein LBJ14_00410 [Desulfarculales bacterium]|nr:hypothetical protein [Desulfarculales bacterium]